MKITSVMVHHKGGHDRVSVWVDGKLAGELVVGADEGWDLICLLEDGAGLGALTTRGRAAVLKNSGSEGPEQGE